RAPRTRFGDEVALIVDCHGDRQRNSRAVRGGGAARATQRENGRSVHYGLDRVYALIGHVPNNTVGAGTLIDRMPEQHLRSSVAHPAPPCSHISRETSRVASGDRERLLGQRAITIWPTGL